MTVLVLVLTKEQREEQQLESAKMKYINDEIDLGVLESMIKHVMKGGTVGSFSGSPESRSWLLDGS